MSRLSCSVLWCYCLCFTLWLHAFVAISGAQELDAATISYLKLGYADRIEWGRSVPPEVWHRVVSQLRMQLTKPEYDRRSLIQALASTGEDDAIQEEAEVFLSNPSYPPDEFALFESPRLVELVGPALFIEERMNVTLVGGDVLIIPKSYRTAVAVIELLIKSRFVSEEVRAWAKTLRYYPEAEKRGFMKVWWIENERALHDRDYQAIKPGSVPVLPPGTAPPSEPTLNLKLLEDPSAPERTPTEQLKDRKRTISRTGGILLFILFLVGVPIYLLRRRHQAG